MKLTVILLLAACLAASGKGLGQSVTLTVKGASLEKVFGEIRKQTGVYFFYDLEDVKKAKTVTVTVKNAGLEEILALCFKDQPLSYAIVNNTVVVKQKITTSPKEQNPNETLQTTTIDVSGRVADAGGNPLVGASVKVKGSTIGTTTDGNGAFVLKGIDENAILVFSHAEHETVELKVESRKTVSVALKRSDGNLQEVVINKGYYTEKQKYSASNIGTVRSDEINKQHINNPLLAMQGRIPSVDITQLSGIPGSTVKIQIRGINSARNGSEPLYVIDGIPVKSGIIGLEPLSNMLGANPSALSYLNPADIESIDVLKDADATSIYGARGANGVILITTKRGRVGKSNIDLSFQQGWGAVPKKLKLLNTPQYLEMRYEAFKNDGVVPSAIPGTLGFAPDLKMWDTTRYTDWQDLMIGGIANYTDAHAALNGGTAVVQYTIGGGYHRETTVFPGKFNDERANIHFSLTGWSNNRKLKMTLTGNFLSDNNKLPNDDFTKYISLAPNAPALYNLNGQLNWENSTWTNPLGALHRDFNSKVANLVGNAIVSYNIFPSLNIKLSAGYNQLVGTSYAAYRMISYDPNDWSTIDRVSAFGNTISRSFIFEPQINYQKEIFSGNFNALIGSSIQQDRNQVQSIQAFGFNSDASMRYMGAARTLRPVASYNEYKYAAMFGRISYDFKTRYSVRLTGRRDASSRFGPRNRYANFASLGAAWIVSNETFFKPLARSINFLKLRFSYGTTGNDQIGDYKYYNVYGFTTLTYQGVRGVISNGVFNPYYGWETTRKLELGSEFGLFNDRAFVTVSYYQNRSSNQLIPYPLPSFVGPGSIIANLPALIQNNGWEFLLNLKIVDRKNFSWRVNFNLTVPRNKLLEFPNIENSSYANASIGKPLSHTRLYDFAGVDESNGTYMFYDSSGKKVATPTALSDRVIFFDNNFKKFYGGFQNSLSYKTLQLDLLFQFVKQNGSRFLYDYIPGYFNVNQPLTVLDRWQKPGDVSSIQRFSQNSTLAKSYDNARFNSDQGFGDASYIRLKNVFLSWQVPARLAIRLKLSDVRIFAQGQNVLTITKYKGLDPENQELKILPPLRTITIGIKSNF